MTISSFLGTSSHAWLLSLFTPPQLQTQKNTLITSNPPKPDTPSLSNHPTVFLHSKKMRKSKTTSFINNTSVTFLLYAKKAESKKLLNYSPKWTSRTSELGLKFMESYFKAAFMNELFLQGFDCCVFVASSLVDMYGKCGVLEDAKRIFDEISDRNVVTWNSMVVGYVQNGMNEEAIRMFYDMRVEGVEPTRVTVASFLSAAANLDAIEEGKQGCAIAIVNGLELDNILGTSLMNFYSKVSLIEDAELVFSKMIERDAVTWNLLISGYVQVGRVEEAIDICHHMRSENLRFDSVTLASLLSASANTINLELGKEGHGYCIRNNLVSDVVVASSIIHMYAKCARINNARWVFSTAVQRDLVLWNTLIAAYAEWGFSGEALKLFYQMQLEGVSPNVVSWNSVIKGFLRLGQILEAENMFAWMQSSGMQPNLITWTSLITGMSESGYGDESILLFKQMQVVGLRPNTASIIGVLSACIKVVSLQYGRAIHGYITRHNFLSSLSISTSLVDMYAKCGSLCLANRVFNILLNKELPIYNAMISGYAIHGRAVEALTLFEQMQKEGLKPDGITFTAVLSACSHAGLVDEGLEVFTKMLTEYRVNPSMEHYGCVVSLLSRGGNLDRALKFILAMPFDPDSHILGSLLTACEQHQALELGEYLSKHLFKLEPDNSGNYVTLSNNYATAGRWDDVQKLRNVMKEKGMRKTPGSSEIQVGTELHKSMSELKDLVRITLKLLQCPEEVQSQVLTHEAFIGRVLHIRVKRTGLVRFLE
ncbi:hypothetical protein IFM89_033105 [Coptis chinensis]|uniref:Pentatricopeptide repeat-containing protein n=1 Tax=Coptis chinensis TaxID=261450 RepID=A0A835M2V8_9MAGN|nr:hypothetical protein IFM89_033105 [Coptis chinensis]